MNNFTHAATSEHGGIVSKHKATVEFEVFHKCKPILKCASSRVTDRSMYSTFGSAVHFDIFCDFVLL